MRTTIVHRHRGSVPGAIHQDRHVENTACEQLVFRYADFVAPRGHVPEALEKAAIFHAIHLTRIYFTTHTVCELMTVSCFLE